MSYLKTAHFVSPHKTARCVLPSWARPKRLGQQVSQCSSTAHCQAEHPLGGRTGRPSNRQSQLFSMMLLFRFADSKYLTQRLYIASAQEFR